MPQVTQPQGIAEFGKLLDLKCSCDEPLEAFLEGIADTSDSTSVRCMDEFSTAAWQHHADAYPLEFQQSEWDKFLRRGIYAAAIDAHVFGVEHMGPLHDVYDGTGNLVAEGHHLFEEPNEESTTLTHDY